MKNSSHTSSLLLAIWLVLSSLILSSCVQVKKREQQPIKLPEKFSLKGGAEKLSDRWWEDFGDPNLNRAIERGLSGNFSLLAARDRLSQAEASSMKNRSSLFPSITGQGVARESWTYKDDGSATTNSFSLGVAASYEVDLWGRVRHANEASILETQSSQADLHTAAISLAAQIASNWFQIAEIHHQIILAQYQREVNQKILELIRVQFKTGKVGIADILQQQQLIESSDGELISLRLQQKLLIHQLNILTGLPPESNEQILPKNLPELPPLPAIGLPLDLLQKRPDIRSGYFTLLAADKKVATAVADRFPKLSISAETSTGGETTSALFTDWLGNIAANLTAPLFDGGQRKAEVARTKAVAAQRFHEYGQLILDALGEVEAALLQEQEQKKYVINLESRLNLAMRTQKRVESRYKQGVADYQRVLSTLLSKQNLEQSLLTAKRKNLEYRIQLYRALGGQFMLPEPDKTESSL